MSESFDARAWLKAQEQNTQPVTPTSAARPFDAKDWLNAQQSRTQNASELGLQQAADFTAQLAKYPTASPVQQYQAFEKYGQQFQDHLAQQGYSGEQITNALASFGQQADPRNQSSGWDTAADLGNSVLKGTGRLMVDALSAVPESTPLIGELAEYLQKEGEGKLRTIEKEYSAAKQINDYLGNREEQKALENGANEVSALLANLKTNPMQLPHLLAEQVPQVLLGVATGGVGLGAVNAAGGVGRARNDIEQAYEDTYKNNPQQLLQLPEIQERMAKGMSFADAVNDAKTDVTDHWKSLAAAAVIGASEALTPTGKLGQGVNRGVLKTFGKEAGQEFLQEGAEQLNSNLAVGQIDGKTQATDNVLRNATLGAITGLGMGVPAATEAYINGRNAPQAEEPVVNPESPIQPEQPTTTLINSQALDEALKPYQDSEDYAEMRADLEQDIQDGVIEERAKSNSQYGKLAQAYLNATGQVTAEPQAESNTQEQAEINDGTDPEMERVLNLRERMTAWRNGKKLGKIGDLLPAMMTFKNEDAKRDFVVQQAFGEVQSIAKKHGIDPTDGNAMRKWLDDYVAKRKEAQTKAKGTKFVSTFGLQLPAYVDNNSSLSARNVKTETDLSQYQNPQSEQSIDTESDEQLTQESYSRSPIKSVDANIKRGREAMNTAIAERRTVHRAMFNHNLDGWVDFEWGDVGTVKANGKTKGGMGISHILEARMRKDGMSYEQAIQMLVSDVVDVIARGHTVFEKTVGNSQNIRMEHNGYQVTLTKNKGNNAWIVTAFELFEGANRKGHDKSIPTDTNPTLSRAGTGASNAASDSEQFARNNRSQLNDTHAHSQRGRGVVAENGLNLNNSQQNVNVEESHARELLRRALGEHADKIEFVRDEQFGENDARRGAEGWYHNGKLYLNLDGITDGNILSKDERLVWVAWHELGHHGVEVQLSHALRNQLYQARKNVVVNGIAKRIFAERQAEAKRENNPSLAISQDVATEEAIVELFAAMETGNWAEIENRYRVHIVQEWRQPQSDLVKRLSHVANFFKRLVARITGRNLDTVSNQEVLNLLATVKQGIAKSAENPTASDARYSLSEESDSDFAKAVDEVFNSSETRFDNNRWIKLGTTPEALIQSGISEEPMYINFAKIGKIKNDHPEMTADLLKQIPKELNNPVAVFKNTKGKANSYVVLTELSVKGNERVIAALHADQEMNGLVFHKLASAYGKDGTRAYLENMIEKSDVRFVDKQKAGRINSRLQLLADDTLDLLFNKASIVKDESSVNADKEKGSQLANVHWLQLPLKLRSDANLSANDIKTETDLSQYQSENSDIRFSRSENLTRADYDQAKENGETELDFNQWKQVRSPEFKRWFGDWENDPDDASKVINDETFEPLQVFHGSPENFHIFDDRFSSKNTGNEGLFGKGFYFAKDGLEAVRYAKGNENGITSAYLNIKNPFTLTPENIALLPDWYVDKVGIVPIKKGALDGKISIDSISRLTKDGKYGNDFRKALSEAGFDGASTEFDPYKPEGVVYVAFEPNQIKSATDNNGEFSSENDDIRFSRKQTSMEILTDGKVKHETLWGTIKAGEFGKIWNEVQRKTDFALTDETRPVLDWIGDLDLAQVQANELKSDFELADGVRHSLNSQLMQRFLKPLHKNIVNLAKKRKKDIEWTKKALGIWVSANYSIRKNQELLARDEQAMIEAKQAFDDAKANGTNAEIDKAERAYIRAERQYRYRKHDVELNNWEVDEKGKFIVPRKVGVAGFSIPHAKALMAEVEKHFSQKEVLEATEPLRKAVKWNIHKNREFNRITEEQFKEYMRNLDYVPLTGDPDSLLKDDDDFIGGASSKGVNTSRDKNMKGRVNSEAEDAIDAVYRMLDKTVANAAWQPFKNGIDTVYEQKLAEAKAQGMTEEQAKEHVADTVGIRRQVMQGTTRTNDEVLIRKFGNVYYEYRLPEEVIKAIKGGQRNVDEFQIWQHKLSPMRYVRKLTGLYAQGVTQFKLPFAPKNMIRDIWEKSALITTRDIYDANGKPLSQKAKNRIGNRTFSALANPAEMTRVLRATSRLAKGDTENLDVSDEYQRDLKELIELGGVSNYSTYLARTDKDLVEEIKKLDKPHHRAVEGALHLVAVWNGTFDYASSLAAYRALKEAGVDKKQAADITLNLTNFRKQGWAAKHFKPLYMFLNPTLQGGKNLVQMMKTRRGQVYLASRVVMAMAVWSLLMSLDDEDDQSGKRMLANGDLSREILIPTGEKDKYIRIPVGYGAPQMANNIATNLVQLMNNQISVGDAVANIITHNVKSVLPIAPSEIPASKEPLAKLFDTLSPTMVKAQLQWVMNRSAFGGILRPTTVQREKLLSQQSFQDTAEFWKETAEMMYEQFGVDMHPEFYKHIFDSYRGMMGSLGDYVSASIENPNRVLQGKSEVIPVANDFYGIRGERRIAGLFREYKGEAEKLAAEYKYYESKGRLAEWKTPEKMQIVNWNNKVNNDMKEVTQARSDLKKDEGKMSKEMKASRLQNINTINDRIQREAVYAWRKREGLATANPR